MKCYLPSVCCDCDNRGCGCSGCFSCHMCNTCQNSEVYDSNLNKWVTLVCEHDDVSADKVYNLPDGRLVYKP